MKASDYIVAFLIAKGVTDAFGYPGGMVTHLMDSFPKYENQIATHVNYHEQASAFAACGYAQSSGRLGVAYATSGPGATNLITGIAHAYFDSIPVLFITGQVNTFESRDGFDVRQRGFQETNIVDMVSGITKFAEYVKDERDLMVKLEQACGLAMDGRKGPVLLDVPMNVQRADIPDSVAKEHLETARQLATASKKREAYISDEIIDLINKARRPVILIGNGVKTIECSVAVRKLVNKIQIPVVSSMISFDVLTDSNYYYGFIGAYGDRTANFIVAKSDLVISIGARLDVRQTGAIRKNFAPEAQIIRADIDEGELSYKVRKDDINIQMDAKEFVDVLLDKCDALGLTDWLADCNRIRSELDNFDAKEPNHLITAFSEFIPENTVITTDVGQNQVWIAQSFKCKQGQKVLFSGGHGAMGCSLPMAIGAYYASNEPVICFTGDGGLQMNIQELQFIVRENLPVTVIVLNNGSLGMIRHFQEMYFDKRYVQTNSDGGYTVPDFCKIAEAYGIDAYNCEGLVGVKEVCEKYRSDTPCLINVELSGDTYVFPKLEYGKPNQDQEPLLDRELYNILMSLDISNV